MSSPRDRRPRNHRLHVVGSARTGRIARGLSASGAPGTLALLATMVVLWVLATAVPSLQDRLFTGSSWGYRFEVWRPLLYSLTTGSLLQLFINGLALYWMGRGLEQLLGTGRFVALYLLAGLGAATVLVLAGPPGAFGGSFAGVLGLFAAQAVAGHLEGRDVRGEVVLVALLVLLGFLGDGGIVSTRTALHGAWLADRKSVV